MVKRIKYWLLRWLLDEVCGESECVGCVMASKTNPIMCCENDILYQARKIWGLGPQIVSRDEV